MIELVGVHIEDADESEEIGIDEMGSGQNEMGLVDGTLEELEEFGALRGERIGRAETELENDSVVLIVRVDETGARGRVGTRQSIW